MQGSAIGHRRASDLHTINDGNKICKYADDTYLVVPAVNVNTRSAELKNITDWATLSLNLINSEKIHSVLQKLPSFDLLSLHTRFDCDNFWPKCVLFSHLT